MGARHRPSRRFHHGRTGARLTRGAGLTCDGTGGRGLGGAAIEPRTPGRRARRPEPTHLSSSIRTEAQTPSRASRSAAVSSVTCTTTCRQVVQTRSVGQVGLQQLVPRPRGTGTPSARRSTRRCLGPRGNGTWDPPPMRAPGAGGHRRETAAPRRRRSPAARARAARTRPRPPRRPLRARHTAPASSPRCRPREWRRWPSGPC